MWCLRLKNDIPCSDSRDWPRGPAWGNIKELPGQAGESQTQPAGPHVPRMMVTEMGTLRGLSPGLCSSQVYMVSATGQRRTASTKHWESGVLTKEAASDTREGSSYWAWNRPRTQQAQRCPFSLSSNIQK